MPAPISTKRVRHVGDTEGALGSAGHRAGIGHCVSGRHGGERGAADDRD